MCKRYIKGLSGNAPSSTCIGFSCLCLYLVSNECLMRCVSYFIMNFFWKFPTHWVLKPEILALTNGSLIARLRTKNEWRRNLLVCCYDYEVGYQSKSRFPTQQTQNPDEWTLQFRLRKAHEAGRYVTTDYVGNQETNVYQFSTEPRKWKKPHSRLYYNITEEQYQLLSGPQ